MRTNLNSDGVAKHMVPIMFQNLTKNLIVQSHYGHLP